MKKQMKIVVSVLLVLCMLMPLATTVFATGVEPAAQQQSAETVSYYTGDANAIATAKAAFLNGSKTKIDTADEFVGFAQASHETNFAGKTITLEADLVFNKGNALDWKTTAPTDYPNWVEVGVSGGTKFAGTFNGKGHVLSGIYFNNPNENPTTDFDGVFEALDTGASILNLGVVNSFFKFTKQYNGVILGRAQGNNVTVQGCYSNAIVLSNSTMDGSTRYIGGIVGHNGGANLLIDSCVFAGVIYDEGAQARCAGILGLEGWYNSNFSTTIRDCVSIGYVTSASNWAASMAGCPTNITFERCMSYGFAASSNGVDGFLAAFRHTTSEDGKNTSRSVAFTDCYIFSDKNQEIITANESTDTETKPIVDNCKANFVYNSITTQSIVGSVPTKLASTWTVRSGRLPMPSTAYANFAKYIDLYDGGASSFINDDITKYIYTAQYYGNSIKKTPTKTFDIDCEDELVAFSKAANAGWFATNANGYTFNLTRDMVFNEGNAEAWQTQPPTYTWTPINSFRGTFNGQGHTISGLYMKTTGHAGLFGQLKENAQVRNLGIVNSYFENTATDGAGTIGAIAGRIMAPSVVVDGCYANAIVRSGSKAGGLIGVVSGTAAAHDSGTAAVVSNCAFFGSVYAKQTVPGTWGGTAGSSVAGIVGHTAGGASANFNDLKIINCVNFGTITNESIVGNGIYSAAAGILGFAEDGKFEITSCFNFGETTGPTGTARYTNNNALIGQVRNDAAVIFVMTDCYIFSDLGQNLFNSTSQPVCNYIKYTINGVTNEQDDDALDDPSTEGVNEGELAQTDSNHINQILTTSASTWTVANSDRVKTVLPFTNGGAWSTRTSCIGSEYPLPTSVYLNFFKVDLKYVQSTDVNNGTYSVRIISEIDSLNYNRAGFKVKVTLENGSSKTLDTMAIKVFKTVVDKDYEAVTAREGKYFVALTLTDMPTTARTYEFTPYTIGDSGEYSYGTTKVLTFDANGVCTDANDEYEYTVVYDSSNADQAILASKIAAAIGNVMGKTVAVIGDEDVAADNNTFEILVGDTNRAQSTTVKNSLSGLKYSITQSGNKIVIAATNATLLDDAVIYFIDNLKNNNGTAQYPYHTSAAYETLALVTNGTANYKIVYTDFYNNLNYHSGNIVNGKGDNSYTMGYTQTKANAFEASLKTLTGATFTLIPENQMSSAMEIVIGKPAGVTMEYFEYYENGIYLKDGDIYIYGHNHEGIAAAINNFLSRVSKIDNNYSILCEQDGYKWKNAKLKYDIPLPTGLKYEGVYTAANDGVYFVYDSDIDSGVSTSSCFTSYCSELLAEGFTQYYETRNVDENLFAGFHKNGEAAWVYYISSRKELRIVFETYQPLPDIATTGTKVQEAYVTQMGVAYPYPDREGAVYVDPDNKGAGMGYIIGLEDGRYIVVDGNVSYGDKSVLAKRYYDYMNNNNEHPSGKIVIAAWIVTHGHSDHYSNFEQFGKLYGSEVECQYIIHNLPTELSLWGGANVDTNYLDHNYKQKDVNFKGAVSFTVHTGYAANIGGVELEFMSTYEDLYNNSALVKYSIDSTNSPNCVDELNDTCLTFRMSFDNGSGGRSTLFFLADNYFAHGERLASMWSDSYMKSNVVQMAHHGYSNGVGNSHEKQLMGGTYTANAYKEIAAEYAFCSAPSGRVTISSQVYTVMSNANGSFNTSKIYYNDYNGEATNVKMTFKGGINTENTNVG